MNASPTFYGNLPTASSQAIRFAETMDKLGSRSRTIQHDMQQLISHAQVWVALHSSNGTTYKVVPAKFAGYDCDPTNYSTHRRSMNGSRAATAIEKWASAVPDSDPGAQAVVAFCAKHGVSPRDEYRVLVAADVRPPAAARPVADASRALVDLVVALLPTLPLPDRARIARAASYID